ncbi:MAG TPA: CHASE3 domain-containing protein [Chthoniobacterales bacterium]|jgi:CHASE3 domain sensor protein|nr:CHASE3 domain-containing protein [Chthoniobacterales bacterium]
MKSSFLQHNRQYLLLVVVLVPLLISGIFFYISRQIRNQQNTALLWVRHSYLVREKLSTVETSLYRAQSTERGYALSGRPEYVGVYVLTRANLLLESSLLRLLVADNPAQEKLADDLQATLQAKLAELTQGMELRAAGNERGASALVNSNAWDQMVTARRQILEMRATEDKLLAERTLTSEKKLDLRENISTALLLMSTVLIVGAGILFLRIQLLQNIITVCAWTQRVNYRGKWMRMEEFLWERFRVKVSHGISEEAFDGVMGIVGKKLTVSERRNEPPPAVREPNEDPSAS